MITNKYILIILFPFLAIVFGCPEDFITIDNGCYYKRHIDVLQDFVDINESIKNIEPQNIGTQEWKDGKLTYLYLGDHFITKIPDSIGFLSNLNHLDLRKNKLRTIPDGICNLHQYHTQINLTDNNICYPYPYCFDYISQQDIKLCETFKCPDAYLEIDGECYNEEHIKVLQTIIENNESLNGQEPLDLGDKIGYQEWANGKLTILNLMNNGLTNIPEEFCSIYHKLHFFDVSNNFICPPYPYCFEYIGRQNTENCNIIDDEETIEQINNVIDNYEISLKLTDKSNLNSNYFQNDLNILQNFIEINTSLADKNPLEIGLQKWENMRLISLDLSDNQLTHVPKDICNITENLKNLNLSNNSICPPYPECIEYIDNQEISLCKNYNCPEGYDKVDGKCYYQMHLQILQNIIDNNASLQGMKPLEMAKEIGLQKWENGHLSQLILSGNQLTNIPESICGIVSQLTAFDISNNSICPPYPACIENIGYQNTHDCVHPILCPEGYDKVDGKCYYQMHLQILQDIIDNNASLQGMKPLEMAKEIGLQKWENGHLSHLILSGNQLTNIPESICGIVSQLTAFDISNNSICPPYPACIENIGYQNTHDCVHPILCLEGYVTFDERCYYNKDLQVLIDFTKLNLNIEDYQPLMLGYQIWENSRLQLLNLDGLEISLVPESIQSLEYLEYLNLNNNKLKALPESLCKIYPNLIGIDLTNNYLCPPYINCFDYIGQQNTENCQKDYCTAGYLEYDEECYYQKDLEVLQDFINENTSLSGRKPLDIGIQKWKNMRLDFLYIGVNELTVIPESICEIYTNLSDINISRNKICPPYPTCVTDIVNGQDTSNCP